MPSPFPGMNPYLEHPDFWPGVHHRLIVAIANYLNPQLVPKYVAAVEVRMYETSGIESTLIGVPDNVIVRELPKIISPSNSAVAAPPVQPIIVNVPISETVKEGYLEIKNLGTGEVIAAIELLSPANKKLGKGRDKYEDKREKVLGSFTHLIEIDLLRQGKRMPIWEDIESDYRILVSRSNTRPKAELYTFNLPENIPCFSVPLRIGDREPLLDLKALIDEIYNQGYYDNLIDYRKEPAPPLSELDSVWVKDLLRDRNSIN